MAAQLLKDLDVDAKIHTLCGDMISDESCPVGIRGTLLIGYM